MIIDESLLCKMIVNSTKRLFEQQDIKSSRFNGILDTIEYYLNMDYKGHELSPEQIQDLTKARDAIVTFGDMGLKWAHLANEVLRSNGVKDDFNSLYRLNESLDDESDYNPWLTGDASYIKGIYNIDGYKVEINTDYNYIAITDETGEDIFFCQDNDAEDYITEMAYNWSHSDNKTNEDVVKELISNYMLFDI